MKLLLALIILITSLVLAITAKASIYINQEVDSNLEKETSLKSEYFDIHKEFFIIDTNNLNSIKSKLYGYIIQENGIIENENIEHLDNHNISRCGAYVYIERDDDLITIKQDFNGSYGLFFFQMKNYYALSNSFFYLLDYIKNKFSLEYNEDYINFLLIQGLCSESCSETPIKNIKLLDKDSVVKINITTSIIDIKNFDFKINQYSISSEEGIKF